MHWKRKWQPTPAFLHGESQGRGSLVGCRLWGRIQSDMTEAISSSSSSVILEGIGGNMFTINTFKALLSKMHLYYITKCKFLRIWRKSEFEMDYFRLPPDSQKGTSPLPPAASSTWREKIGKHCLQLFSFLHLLPSSFPFQSKSFQFFYSWPVGERICTLNGGTAQLPETIY